MHDARIPGHPDLYLPKYKTALFVHGCYWHRHQETERSRQEGLREH
ncbi:hypothetical protein [uncultured Selenomonas sp.]